MMSTNFGKDVSCLRSIRSGRYVTGTRLVAEAYFRRLTTPRGLLEGGEEEANYGLDLTEYVGTTSSIADLRALEGRIVNELAKDERTERTDVTVAVSGTGPLRKLQVVIRAQTSAGPFQFQMSVGQASAEFFGFEEAA